MADALADPPPGDLAVAKERGAGLLAIVPTFNEADRLDELVRRLVSALPAAHLLIVDDRSPDGTATVCRQLQSRYSQLFLVERDGPRGLGRALAHGLTWGLERDYGWLATLDADLSHDPATLPDLLTAATSGCGVVIGSRYTPGGSIERWGLTRRILSRTANRFARRLLSLTPADVTSGYRLYRPELLAVARPDRVRSTGYAFEVELLFRMLSAGARAAEVPIRFVERRGGRSKLSLWEVPRGAFSLLRLRWGTGARPARSS